MQIHQEGIIHTDMKKGHVFVCNENPADNNPSVRIIDFDFSRISGEYEPVCFVTTPLYTSPEYLKDELVDFESDVFSLGVILYELLCKEYPYDIENGPDDYASKVLVYDIKNRPI